MKAVRWRKAVFISPSGVFVVPYSISTERLGEEMKVGLRYGVMVAVIASLLSSCSMMPFRPLASGEIWLTSVKMPEIVNENMPYDVIVSFKSDGEPQIKEVCFHWAVDKAEVPAPSLYMFTQEVQRDKPSGTIGSRWIAEGMYVQMSSAFCSPAQKVMYGTYGSLTARIETASLDRQYNRLECRVKYLQDGVLKETNKVVAKIVVEK